GRRGRVRRPRAGGGGGAGVAAAWVAAAAVGACGIRAAPRREAPPPAVIDRQEAEEIWAWIRQVEPDDAVLADYEVSAPLSSRHRLYSYIMDVNLPPGFPHLGPEFRWLFVRNDLPPLHSLLDQSFRVVHRGPYLTIAHRRTISLVGISNFFRFRANNSSRYDVYVW